MMETQHDGSMMITLTVVGMVDSNSWILGLGKSTEVQELLEFPEGTIKKGDVAGTKFVARSSWKKRLL